MAAERARPRRGRRALARRHRPRASAPTAWPLIDRIGYWLCWATGVVLCLIALGIVAVHARQGHLLPAATRCSCESPAPSTVQSQSGGFLDPIVGTLIVTGDRDR